MVDSMKSPLYSRASKAAVAFGVCAIASGSLYAVIAAKAPTDRGEDAAPTAATAAALVSATSGAELAQVAAIGESAKVINASMPFSRDPVAGARPFVVSGDATDEQRALLCLTQAVYYEAGFEPLAGRRAVAQVVLNRMRHPAFPNSVCGVVYQGAGTRVCQFTFVCDGALARSPELGAWRQARAIADAALSGSVERSVGQSTHYHADYVAPRWAPLLTKVAQIGAHIFYRWPGGWGRPQAFTARYMGEPADPAALRPRLVLASANASEDALAERSGPPVRRAANDVGGLLDTSKGWTLQIPDPRELGDAASRVLADQQHQPKAIVPVAVASAAAPARPVR